jgi:beta-glucanase (GH16 family)
LVALTTYVRAAGPDWSLVWADEFDSGTQPDPAKWVHDLGGGGWGNRELQTYTDRTNNIRIAAGSLVIEARAEQFTGTDGRTRDYTSARLKTKGKAAWTYGRIEARIQVPRGQGIWPAFWTLGTNQNSVGWPACGEIDIMEHIGREPTQVHGTILGPGYSGGGGIGKAFPLPDGKAFADDFHVFAAEWEPERIRWFVDGRQYFEVTPANLPPDTKWVFDAPQFVLLNLAVGGNWPGAPDATTMFPQRMRVDYVRVYARPAR